MTLRIAVLLLAVAAMVPALASDDSIVHVTASQDAYPLSCTTALVWTVRTLHTGRVSAIGLEDRNRSWTLSGQSGACNPWSGGVDHWKSESHVSASVLNTYLETTTQFDQTCTKLSNLEYLAETNAVNGPWDASKSVMYVKLPCQSYSCEE
jgi:hypothetical protein